MVPYGKHARQVLDFYQPSRTNRPRSFSTFTAVAEATGDKKINPSNFSIKAFLSRQSTIALVKHAGEEKVVPP